MTEPLNRQEQLRAWYLATLRRKALEESAGAGKWTPAGLIVADCKGLEEFIAERVSTRAAQVHLHGRSRFGSKKLIMISSSILIVVILALGLFIQHSDSIGPVELASLVTLLVAAIVLAAAAIELSNRLVTLRQSLTANLESDQSVFLRPAADAAGRRSHQDSGVAVAVESAGLNVTELSAESLLSLLFARVAMLEERQNL